jgi:hypothetical protein
VSGFGSTSLHITRQSVHCKIGSTLRTARGRRSGGGDELTGDDRSPECATQSFSLQCKVSEMLDESSKNAAKRAENREFFQRSILNCLQEALLVAASDSSSVAGTEQSMEL